MNGKRRRWTEVLLATLLWLGIALILATAGHYFLKMSFWAAFIIGAGALAVNGLVAEVADR
jgi:NhaP-type Na+/H+ or K+/H+ antiporter